MSTTKNNKQIEIMRHSLSHIMAAAIQELYPNVRFAIGPAIENGFYYDFDFGDEKIGEDDLVKIEKKMNHLIKQNLKFKKFELSINEAIAKEKKVGQNYKMELIEDLKKDKEKKVSYYRLEKFEDLCRGPHIESTGKIAKNSFKLAKLAGAYWRGDEKNKMLTRIYGIAFETKKELDDYLKMMEGAEKRDHRKLGKELKLFIIKQEVGLGLPMWLPRGAMIWRIMEDFWYNEHLKNGYELVRSPHIGSRQLWEKSGHWDFYNDSMYPPMEVGRSLEEAQQGKKAKIKEEYLIKPMNCPFHIVLYNSQIRSYRELPIRWAECGTVYRYEKSGELSGLTRVRGFTQDDAHIICSKEQAEDELKRVLDFIIFTFKSFGFNNYKVYLSVRDPKIKKYAGSEKGWEFTEQILEKVAKAKGLKCEKDIGGAIFYGPKLDFKIQDCLGREWQCSTLQYDFNLPERLNMSFINKKGEEERPYMLHRVLFGSFERFLGLLIEHYAGAFPVWLSPVQVKIISVGADHKKYCHKLADEFKKYEIRVEVDDANETVGNKIRKATKEKMPYMLVIGDKEMSAQGGSASGGKSDKLAVRERGIDKIREIDKDGFIKEIKEKIKNRK